MRILLDTHILLWSLADSKELSKKARKTINESDNVFVSVASLWEIAIKSSLGKLETGVEADELNQIIIDSGFEILTINPDHISPIHSLPLHHRDPFDRLLIAQSIVEPLRFITHDQQLASYGNSIVLV